jgi:hypothetical protein
LNWMVIPATTIFVSGAFLAFALTSLPRLTLHNWIYWAGGRIMWQLGGGVWFGIALWNALEGRDHWKGAALGALIGLALCFNPVADIVWGPHVWQGRVTHVEIWHGRLYRRTGFSETIHARIHIQTQDNEQHIELSGRQVDLWGEVFEQCYQSGGMIRAVALRRLNVILDADCSTIRSERQDGLSRPASVSR